jgi:hypothetical protein
VLATVRVQSADDRIAPGHINVIGPKFRKTDGKGLPEQPVSIEIPALESQQVAKVS